ncbi:MAG: serine/threonine-protein phosphatase [Bacteroidales bacterium]|nr:serine/threonine-protein phosphatase [Bacteroidales bacterium]
MKIESFSQLGKRSNNEDSLGYSEHVLMVCDGVGGHVSGERASGFVIQEMLKHFEQPIPDLGKETIQQMLDITQKDMNALLEKEPELEKMGTTFTGIFPTPQGWFAAHIGDSRIYLYRPAEEKLWHTWDQSLVGEMMRYHDITLEAGRFHPMSNRISNAIIANSTGKISKAAIVRIDELKAGDIFLLCSDGVVEGWGDSELIELMADNSLSLAQKRDKMAAQCAELSRDNNTAMLVEIEEGDAFSIGRNEELEWTTFQDIRDDFALYLKQQQEAEEETAEEDDFTAAVTAAGNTPNTSAPDTSAQNTQSVPTSQPDPKPSRNKLYLFIALLCLLLLAGIGGYYWSHSSGKKQSENVISPIKTDHKQSSKGKNGTGLQVEKQKQDNKVNNSASDQDTKDSKSQSERETPKKRGKHVTASIPPATSVPPVTQPITSNGDKNNNAVNEDAENPAATEQQQQ